MRQSVPCRFAALLRSPFNRMLLRKPGSWKPLLLTALLLPPLLAGGASGAFYLKLHRVSKTLRLSGFPVASPPDATRRILVLSPHCDDETLALGGRIADARRAGADVTVAFLTNGDGFTLSASRALGEVRVSADDHIRFAEHRQKEALAALRELDVPRHQIKFLSYPDRGLEALWTRHWDEQNPFRSPYTARTRSPYTHVYTPGAVHCGASLLSDLAHLLNAVRPTDIYVTHPADDHPDHAAAAAFAQAALLEARDRGAAWANAAKLRFYLVHRGDWPLPQGLHAEKPLLPPAGMVALDTRWEVYPLSAEARAAKTRALARYVSQMAITRRFLTSFVRENELYGSLPEARAGAGQVVPDAVRDDVVRYAGASADLSGLSVEQDRGALHIRVRTRGPISPRVRYSLLLRTDRGRPGFLKLDLPARSKGSSIGSVRVRANTSTFDVTVPLASLAEPKQTPRRVWVAAQTQWTRVLVDQTGFRLFTLPDATPEPPRQIR